MATKKDIFDTLVEVFDPDDFAQLVKQADNRTRLNAYQDIVRLLSYRAKNSKADTTTGDMEKLIDSMFNKKKKKDNG